MKELSINEKAKAYDEAIERAKKLYGNEIAEEIFHELKECDDERIKKNCIHFLELQKQHHAATFEIEECIDWLEKQCETSPILSNLSNTGKNKPKFDPKTLKPFDKVLVRRGSEDYNVWFPDFVSDPPNGTNNKTLCMCVMEDITMVIPYNNDTKHLVETTEEAPEYYRYWED